MQELLKNGSARGLAALAFVTAACSREDIIADIPAPEEGIPFSATITTDSDSQTTRTTLKEETDGSISVKWNSSDRVAMVYEVGGATVVTEATVTPKDDDSGEATITALLDANVTGGTAVTLIYPYSAVDPATGNVLDDYLSTQECTLTGTTESIATKYDLRQGKGTITLATGIGSGHRAFCGNILINGGDVTAYAGDFAAGIGCGVNAHCGTITIGGNVYYDGQLFLGEGSYYLATSPQLYLP